MRVSILAVGFFACSAIGAAQSAPIASDTVVIQQVVTNGFIHPGIGLTKDMLENARAQVLAQREPWFSGFQRMAANPFSAPSISIRNQSRTDPSRPESDNFDSRNLVGQLAGDSGKAYYQALMYYFTGNEVHRANSMRIIRIWSRLDPQKFRSFSEDHIHACYPVQNLIRATELMRYTRSPKAEWNWTDANTEAFTRNFVVPSLNTFFKRNGHFMNQAGYPMAVTIAGDIFLNDRADYEKRVEWFTVNKDAPNQGWSFSIHDLARRVTTNALTGLPATEPQVQLMEMGRDQAHAGDDVEIFNNVARLLNAQGTKVDPVAGTVSTRANAVGVYEFLDDRILAATDYFCRFMLGYDTPWIPVPYDIAPDGKVRGIYPRIAGNYRGRLRQFEYWDIYYYYTCLRGVDLAKKAPYFNEAFVKRIAEPDTDWIYIPKNVSGEGAKPLKLKSQNIKSQTDGLSLARQTTPLERNSSVVKEGDGSFLRVKSTEAGARVAFLGGDTDRKTIAMRVRTSGFAEIAMSGFKRPWLLPDTKGEWWQVTYTMDDLERLGDIVFCTVKGAAGIQVDLDQLIVRPDKKNSIPQFTLGNQDLRVVTAIGLPVQLKLAVSGTAAVRLSSADKPAHAVLDSATGAFEWTPTRAGNVTFIVTANDGKFVTPKRVIITVATDRAAAVQTISAGYDAKVPYVAATQRKYQETFQQVSDGVKQLSGPAFAAKLRELESAVKALQPLTPLLPDGSMDYPGLVVTNTTKNGEIVLLTDGNDDTFAVYFSAKDLSHVFDFGENFRFSATAFALEGRLNFEGRTQNAAFLGSNDGKTWVQLTPEMKKLPTELERVEVYEPRRNERFRLLKVQKRGGPLFEPAELRIYGIRHETGGR